MMKLAWKVVIVCFLLLMGCTLFVMMWNFREPRIEKFSADAGASNDRLTSPLFAKTVTRQQGLAIERADSTSNKTTDTKISRTLPAGTQKYDVESRKQSAMENVVNIKKASTTTKAQTWSNQKQDKQMYEMEPKTVHAATRLHAMDVTTQTDHPHEQRSGIEANQPEVGKIARPSSSRSSLTSSEEPLVELIMGNDVARQNSEAARNKIMLTIRTTKSFHKKRLPVVFDTWLTTVNASNVFLVTDGVDEEYVTKTEQLGMHYVNVECGTSYGRWSLCCKSGEEMNLMFRPENLHYDWYCHMDDDIYLIEDNLVKLLSNFDAKNEDVYLGRSARELKKPYKLNPKRTLAEVAHNSVHFAVGGMYCITRPLLERGRPWLGSGKVFGSVCDKLLEPEDVSVGAVMEILLNVTLSRTELIQTHGLFLKEAVNSAKLGSQVAIAYGCGQLCHIPDFRDNAVIVPNARFSRKEDPSMFRSLHCHLYPDTHWC